MTNIPQANSAWLPCAQKCLNTNPPRVGGTNFMCLWCRTQEKQQAWALVSWDRSGSRRRPSLLKLHRSHTKVHHLHIWILYRQSRHRCSVGIPGWGSPPSEQELKCTGTRIQTYFRKKERKERHGLTSLQLIHTGENRFNTLGSAPPPALLSHIYGAAGPTLLSNRAWPAAGNQSPSGTCTDRFASHKGYTTFLGCSFILFEVWKTVVMTQVTSAHTVKCVWLHTDRAINHKENLSAQYKLLCDSFISELFLLSPCYTRVLPSASFNLCFQVLKLPSTVNWWQMTICHLSSDQLSLVSKLSVKPCKYSCDHPDSNLLS